MRPKYFRIILFRNMKYSIEYIMNINENELNNKLVLYDFGDIKGFLYNDEFTMYKILERKDTIEIVETYDNVIPKVSFSIEKYDCIYDNNTYKTKEFSIAIKPYLDVNSAEFKQPLVQPQKKHAYIKQNSPVKNVARSCEAPLKVQREVLQKQPPSNYQNVLQSQWTSLEQLMKGPLLSLAQAHR